MSAEPLRDSDLPRLEKYDLICEIGHGGMATVYRAIDKRLGREVAVKVIHRHLRENAEVATRFVAEARAAAKLKHRGIVEVYDVSGEEDREKFLVVELVRGPTLRKVLVDLRSDTERYGAPDMPAEIGAAIVCELCDAIQHAHSSGVVHRDIKPENVVVELPDLDEKDIGERATAVPENDTFAEGDDPTKSGPARSDRNPRSQPRSGRQNVVIKITDFGIAKILDAQGVTSTGQVLGSPAHMAPEQIEGGEVDPRTDVFALGVVLYECLVGHLPFEGKNPAQVLRRVIEGTYARAELERPSVGSVYSRIVDSALATDPSERPASPAALAALLRAELTSLGLGEPSDEIAGFFRDPSGYATALQARLVARLVARGEAARKSKDPSGAAVDFNRAHALAPDDLAILRRMTQLGASDGRRRILTRGLFLLVACGALGSAAYGAVRYARGRATDLGPESAPTKMGEDGTLRVQFPRLVEHRGDATGRLSPSAAPSVRVAATPRLSGSPELPPPASTSAAPVSGEPRPVRFAIQPKGATLEVDGVIIEHNRAEPYRLKPGPHTARLTPAPGDKSAEPNQGSKGFEVKPQNPDKPDEVQGVSLSLAFRPAHVKLVGAAGLQAICGPRKFTAGAAVDVPMDKPQWDITCRFILGDEERSAYQTIKAGEDNNLVWPQATKPSP